MAIKVTILSDFAPEDLEAAAEPEFMSGVLESVMSGARNEWLRLANSRLRSSRRDYANGIQPVEVGDGFAAVELLGELPNMVENGADPFDMHQTLLGPNVPVAPAGQRGKRVNKDGKFYRSIPFRHQTPGTAGQGGGQVMGSQWAKFSDQEMIAGLVFGKRAHQTAKRLKPTVMGPDGKTQWGGRLREGMAAKLRPHHSTDIFAGMVRMQKQYPGGNQNTYMTFRTISDAVPDKWQHPGIEAAHLASEVQKYVERVAAEAFLAAARSLL
jgi:hypothetical protein